MSFAGRTHSAETREKISAAQKGKPRKPLSAETREKISAARKGIVPVPDWVPAGPLRVIYADKTRRDGEEAAASLCRRLLNERRVA